jgi:hypothetical protein
MVDGVEVKKPTKENALENPELCVTCQTTKAHRQVSRRSAQRSKIYGKFGRIHFDLVQINEAFNGHKWMTHLYLEGIRFHIAKTHPNKDGCVKAIREAIGLCRNQFGIQIRVFKSDREKPLSSEFLNYLFEEGIIWERSVVGTPEQNGFIERAGGVIIVVARAMLADANLPKSLWPLAVSAAAYVLNRTPTMLPSGKTVVPWTEAMSAKAPESPIKPNVANLRIFGCGAWVRTQKIPKKDKMAPRAQLGYLVGYVASNIWKIWFPATGAVREERDVIFDESIRFNGEEPPAQLAKIPEIDPWGVATGQVETESSDEEDPLPITSQSATPQTQVLEGETALEKSLSSMELHDHHLPTPAPSPSRQFEPEDVPGAFPVERNEGGSTSTSQPHVPAEGVDRSQPEPEDQLRSELESQLESQSDSDSPPPLGYRERGTLAPRDINGDFSESNILSGKRSRKRTSHLAAMTAVVHGGQDEENHEGVLLAFSTAMGSFRNQETSTRDDLSPEPKNWSEMMEHPHCESFVKAAELEIDTLRKKNAFIEVDKPTDQSVQILPLKWVFTYKFNSDGLLTKHKARICVRGDLERVLLDEIYSATLAVRTARFTFALAAHFNLDTTQWDAVNAFLNSLLPTEVYVELPPGMFSRDRKKRCWKLIKALYGLRKSPRLWQQEASRVLTELGFQVVYEDMCLFVREGIIIIFYVDDLIMFNHVAQRAEATDIAKRLNEAWELRSMGEAQWFLGIRILRNREIGAIWLWMPISQQWRISIILLEAGNSKFLQLTLPISNLLKEQPLMSTDWSTPPR